MTTFKSAINDFSDYVQPVFIVPRVKLEMNINTNLKLETWIAETDLDRKIEVEAMDMSEAWDLALEMTKKEEWITACYRKNEHR